MSRSSAAENAVGFAITDVTLGYTTEYHLSSRLCVTDNMYNTLLILDIAAVQTVDHFFSRHLSVHSFHEHPSTTPQDQDAS